MRVSQRFIDLLNVPLIQLRAAAEGEKIVGAKSMTKWTFAEKLAQLPRERIEDLAEGYLYAGRTSLTFFRLDAEQAGVGQAADEIDGDEDPLLAGRPLDASGVGRVLTEMSGGTDPFSDAARPDEVTPNPKLVVARPRDDGSILMSFAFELPVAQVIRNFEPTSVYADDYFNVVLYADG